MARPRILDYSEVERVYAELRSVAATARHFNVAYPTIRRIVDPVERARVAAYQQAHRGWVGTCPVCGGPASNRRPQRRNSKCKACKDHQLTTSVREDTLRCGCCGLWLPDDDFPRQKSKPQRRYRHSTCRPCGRVGRRDRRISAAKAKR